MYRTMQVLLAAILIGLWYVAAIVGDAFTYSNLCL